MIIVTDFHDRLFYFLKNIKNICHISSPLISQQLSNTGLTFITGEKIEAFTYES